MFDPKLMSETERCSARSLQIVYHDYFRDVAKAHRPPTTAATAEVKQPVGDMCYNSSWRVHKGKLFVLVSCCAAIQENQNNEFDTDGLLTNFEPSSASFLLLGREARSGRDDTQLD